MPKYEYKVVPAPTKGRKAKGVKTPEGRFALSIEDILNEMGRTGWEYLRAELLPSEERSGLTSSVKNWRNVLVFRRALAAEGDLLDPVSPPVQTGERAELRVLAASAVPAASEANRIAPLSAEADHIPETPEAAGTADEGPPDAYASAATQDMPEPEPFEDPEPRRTPPTLDDDLAEPEPNEKSQAETDRLRDEWDQTDDTPLSGIEKVIRHTAKQNAGRRDDTDQT